MKNVEFNDLKIGELIVIDPDCFMLGDRQCIISINDEEIKCQLYHMGKLFEFRSYDATIKRENIEKWWTRKETLESWRKKINYE